MTLKIVTSLFTEERAKKNILPPVPMLAPPLPDVSKTVPKEDIIEGLSKDRNLLGKRIMPEIQ